jgi:hypothetical protein
MPTAVSFPGSRGLRCTQARGSGTKEGLGEVDLPAVHAVRETDGEDLINSTEVMPDAGGAGLGMV